MRQFFTPIQNKWQKWFFYVNSAFGYLQRVALNSAAGVSEVHTVSFFRVKMSDMSDCSCTHKFWTIETREGRIWTVVLFWPIGTRASKIFINHCLSGAIEHIKAVIQLQVSPGTTHHPPPPRRSVLPEPTYTSTFIRTNLSKPEDEGSIYLRNVGNIADICKMQTQKLTQRQQWKMENA
jgi:hypothetical protein